MTSNRAMSNLLFQMYLMSAFPYGAFALHSSACLGTSTKEPTYSMHLRMLSSPVVFLAFISSATAYSIRKIGIPGYLQDNISLANPPSCGVYSTCTSIEEGINLWLTWVKASEYVSCDTSTNSCAPTSTPTPTAGRNSVPVPTTSPTTSSQNSPSKPSPKPPTSYHYAPRSSYFKGSTSPVPTASSSTTGSSSYIPSTPTELSSSKATTSHSSVSQSSSSKTTTSHSPVSQSSSYKATASHSSVSQSSSSKAATSHSSVSQSSSSKTTTSQAPAESSSTTNSSGNTPSNPTELSNSKSSTTNPSTNTTDLAHTRAAANIGLDTPVPVLTDNNFSSLLNSAQISSGGILSLSSSINETFSSQSPTEPLRAESTGVSSLQDINCTNCSNSSIWRTSDQSSSGLAPSLPPITDSKANNRHVSTASALTKSSDKASVTQKPNSVSNITLTVNTVVTEVECDENACSNSDIERRSKVPHSMTVTVDATVTETNCDEVCVSTQSSDDFSKPTDISETLQQSLYTSSLIMSAYPSSGKYVTCGNTTVMVTGPTTIQCLIPTVIWRNQADLANATWSSNFSSPMELTSYSAVESNGANRLQVGIFALLSLI